MDETFDEEPNLTNRKENAVRNETFEETRRSPTPKADWGLSDNENADKPEKKPGEVEVKPTDSTQSQIPKKDEEKKTTEQTKHTDRKSIDIRKGGPPRGSRRDERRDGRKDDKREKKNDDQEAGARDQDDRETKETTTLAHPLEVGKKKTGSETGRDQWSQDQDRDGRAETPKEGTNYPFMTTPTKKLRRNQRL